MMKIFFIVLTLGLLLIGSVKIMSEDDFGDVEELTIKSYYTPSQNLAIMEGRFDDAKKSIEEIEERKK